MDQDEKKGERKKIKTSTGLIAIFAAVVLFFGGAWTYWTYNDSNSYSSSTDSTVVSKTNINTNSSETTDWKTYTSTNYKFSLKYPTNVAAFSVGNVNETTGKQMTASLVGEDPSVDITTTDTDLTLFSFTNIGLTSFTIDKLKTDILAAGQSVPYPLGYPTNLNTITADNLASINTTFAGKAAIKITLNKKPTGLTDDYAFYFVQSDDNQVYEIIVNESNQIAKTILSTFKFTDLTADWKTYTNGTYGFSIKYPKNVTPNESEGGKNIAFPTDVDTKTYQDCLTRKDTECIKTAPLVIQVNNSSQENTETWKLSLDDIIKDKVSQQSINNQVKTTLNGQPAYEGFDMGMIGSYEILAKSGSNLLELVFGSTDSDTFAASKAKLTETQKSMLASFQFTK